LANKKSAATRDRILVAASRLFSEKGYYNTSMGDIAQAAGMGRASLYYYFPNREHVARALLDSIMDQIREAAWHAAAGDDHILLRTLVQYILLFKHIALNKATQAVYYDLVSFADYGTADIERVKNSYYQEASKLAEAYSVRFSEQQLIAGIITSEATSKALFKGILKGTLRFSLEEAMDYFCRHSFLCDIPIPEHEYRETLAAAFKICSKIGLAAARAACQKPTPCAKSE